MKQPGGEFEFAAGEVLALHLFGDDRLDQVLRHRAPVGEMRAVAHPLPHLRPRDLGRRGVFHQVVDRDAA